MVITRQVVSDRLLAYLAAADTAQFPLTWDICADFLERLGMTVKIVAAEQAG
jgi:hypothetical protein